MSAVTNAAASERSRMLPPESLNWRATKGMSTSSAIGAVRAVGAARCVRGREIRGMGRRSRSRGGVGRRRPRFGAGWWPGCWRGGRSLRAGAVRRPRRWRNGRGSRGARSACRKSRRSSRNAAELPCILSVRKIQWVAGDFFIHGVQVPGGAGCIDLTSDIGDFAKEIAKLPKQRKVKLTVRYAPVGRKGGRGK